MGGMLIRAGVLSAVIMLWFLLFVPEQSKRPSRIHYELPLGETNPPLVRLTDESELRPGQKLWFKTNYTHSGTVVQISEAHPFPDGEIKPGVLLRGNEDDLNWFPRASVKGMLTEVRVD